VRRQPPRWRHRAAARRILEDINGSRPLAEIVEEIAELVSFTLDGAPCWCQIANGARLGNCPAKLTGLRIVKKRFRSFRPPLGTLFAALDPLTKPGPTNRKPSPWGGTGHAGHRNPKALLRPLAPFGV